MSLSFSSLKTYSAIISEKVISSSVKSFLKLLPSLWSTQYKFLRKIRKKRCRICTIILHLIRRSTSCFCVSSNPFCIRSSKQSCDLPGGLERYPCMSKFLSKGNLCCSFFLSSPSRHPSSRQHKCLTITDLLVLGFMIPPFCVLKRFHHLLEMHL